MWTPSCRSLVVVASIVAACGSPRREPPPTGDVDASTTDAPGPLVDGSLPPADAPPPPIDASPDARIDGGMSAAIAVCGNVSLSTTFQSMPAQESDHYVRCETRGPEMGTRAVVSSDGNRVAVVTSSGTARLFGTRPWREITQIAAPIGAIDAVAFAPDGSWLATLSAEMGTVTLWSPESGARGRTFSGPPASTVDTRASALAFSPDGRFLATSLGIVIDLVAGESSMAFNGGTVRHLEFATDRYLFVDFEYQIGNSPVSRRLFIVDRTSGAQTTLFEMYDRALTGYAISADHRLVAVGRTEEAEVGGFERGLHLFRAEGGTLVAKDNAFAGTVLGFSHDGARLFTAENGQVMVRDTADLHVIRSFAWAVDPINFLGVSPNDELVARTEGSTRWWSTSTGTIVKTVSRALTSAAWTADGSYGVGPTTSGSMFAFWRESDLSVRCAPAAIGGTAPSLESLGTVVDANGNGTSTDGSIAVTTELFVHTHATNYYTATVSRTATGEVLRRFSPSPSRPLAMSNPDAARLFTNEGQAVAVWCQ
jgi:WD40 repeat protein